MWNKFVSVVSALTATVQTNLHNRFMRMIEIEQTSVSKVGDFFSPKLGFGQVVKVKFVGQGSVLDGPHFAIVWDAQPKSDHIVVLPMTSKVRDRFYDLGRIDGLRMPNNVVKVNQPQTVSRKSVEPWFKKDAQNVSVPVELTPNQKIRVTDLFRLSQLKEPSLQTVIMDMIGDEVPVEVDKALLGQLRRPVTFLIESEQPFGKLWFRFHDDTGMRLIKIVKPGLGFGERKKLLRELLSDDDSIRKSSEKRLEQIVASQVAAQQTVQAAPTKPE